MTHSKVYLGDAVYAELSGGMIRLTTEDGLSASNTIYLEPQVWLNLLDFAKSIKWVPNKGEKS